MYKTLCQKAFRLLLIGLLGLLALSIVSGIVSIAVPPTVEDFEMMQEIYADLGLYDNTTYEDFVDTNRTGSIFILVVSVAIYGLFLGFLLKHKKSPGKGTYITVLMVFNVIAILFGAFTLITSIMPPSDVLSIVTGLPSLACNVLIILGYAAQKSYIPPVPPASNPYGHQQPYPYYPPNPYPPQYPQGNNPYGQQPPYPPGNNHNNDPFA